jgi:hypothetical protein
MTSGYGAIWWQVYTRANWNLRCRFSVQSEGHRYIVGVAVVRSMPTTRDGAEGPVTLELAFTAVEGI